jgi:hypothetical protein
MIIRCYPKYKYNYMNYTPEGIDTGILYIYYTFLAKTTWIYVDLSQASFVESDEFYLFLRK